MEFCLKNVGKVALIHCALYGGKAAGRDFRNHLRLCMLHLNFESCPADPDVWMRPAKKTDGTRYWEYILLYTDDALCMLETPEATIRGDLGCFFELQEESIGPPKIYFGGGVHKVTLDNDVQAWAFSSSQYVQAAVKNVESYNQSVLANTTIPDSILKKKSQSIAYHFVRKGSACDEWRTTYVNTHDNEADLLTKLLPSGAKRKGFVRGLLHHIF